MPEPMMMAAAGASVLSGVMGFKGSQAAAKSEKAVTDYENAVAEKRSCITS